MGDIKGVRGEGVPSFPVEDTLCFFLFLGREKHLPSESEKNDSKLQKKRVSYREDIAIVKKALNEGMKRRGS